MTMKETSCTLLIRSMEQEYRSFLKGLEQEPLKTLPQRAYEIQSKEDILILAQQGFFTEEEAGALCQRKCPLEDCYRAWMTWDTGADHEFRNCLKETAEAFLQQAKTERGKSMCKKYCSPF